MNRVVIPQAVSATCRPRRTTSFNVLESFALFQGNGYSKAIPIGTDQVYKIEKDLLSRYDACCPPYWEGTFG